MAAGAGGMGGSGKIWGPKPPMGSRNQGSVHSQGLGGAVGHLHEEHPHHVQGEGLQHKSTAKIHYPISEGTYKGK
jgi:hypothetical protein